MEKQKRGKWTVNEDSKRSNSKGEKAQSIFHIDGHGGETPSGGEK